MVRKPSAKAGFDPSPRRIVIDVEDARVGLHNSARFFVPTAAQADVARRQGQSSVVKCSQPAGGYGSSPYVYS